MAHVCLLGLGYIGLPTAASLSLHGNKVTGVDVRPNVVEDLKRGNVHVREPDLTAVVRDALRTGNLVLSHEPVAADVFLLCVQSPLDGQRADLRYLKAATESVVPLLRAGNLVIVESTVPPGTTNNVVRPLLESSGLQAGRDFYLAFCPERVMPGQILREIVENDRVIGGIDAESAARAKELYSTFVRGEIFTTDCTTAEFVKLIENAYRDVNIAFANDLSWMAERLGVNVWDAISLANRHPRVQVLRPGPGVGGHCIPVDSWFIMEAVGESPLLRTTRNLNDAMPGRVVEMVLRDLEGVASPKVAIWGVAYKGGVGDLRGSPGVEVVLQLSKRGVRVVAYDPHVPHNEFSLSPLDECVKDSDCIAVLADHREFRFIDPASVGREMRHKYLIDTRNCLDHGRWRQAGFRVHVLGDGTAK